MKETTTVAPLKKLNSLIQTRDSRQPYADVTNAPFLMGDADFGDPDFGDPDFGDPNYGDPNSTSPLATFDALIGDIETGGLSKRQKQALGLAAGAAAGVSGGIALNNYLKRRNAEKAATANRLRNSASKMTIQRQINARGEMGKIAANAKFPFFQVTGANLNSAPISPTESFVAATLKINFDRQQTDTPFEVEIVQGTFAGVTWSLASVGIAANRYYVAVFLVIGINALAGNPGLIFTVTGILPTIQGTLTISTNPLSFTILPGFYSKICIFPWTIVMNKPLLVIGQYSVAAPISFSITGLPSTASVSMTIPGSQHTWTIGMRNRML
jgi:hypothetical protein